MLLLLLLILRTASLCQIPTVLQAKHAENICEKQVKSSQVKYVAFN